MTPGLTYPDWLQPGVDEATRVLAIAEQLGAKVSKNWTDTKPRLIEWSLEIDVDYIKTIAGGVVSTVIAGVELRAEGGFGHYIFEHGAQGWICIEQRMPSGF